MITEATTEIERLNPFLLAELARAMGCEDNPHARQQAAMKSSVTLEFALDRETAAEDFAATLSQKRCEAILDTVGFTIGDYDGIEEMREAVADGLENGKIDDSDAGFEFDEDEARQRIQEDALEVSVRSDWHSPGETDVKPTEFLILLTTGGPALRIRGELDRHMEPDRAWLEHQDWGTPWQEYITTGEDHDALLTYARNFYFGE